MVSLAKALRQHIYAECQPLLRRVDIRHLNKFYAEITPHEGKLCRKRSITSI
jgi:hypothetical protein